MAKNQVITTVVLDDDTKTTIYVDNEKFYKLVKYELLKRDMKLKDLVQQALADYMNGVKNSKEYNPDTPGLYKQVKNNIEGEPGVSLKSIVNDKMVELVRKPASL